MLQLRLKYESDVYLYTQDGTPLGRIRIAEDGNHTDQAILLFDLDQRIRVLRADAEKKKRKDSP